MDFSIGGIVALVVGVIVLVLVLRLIFGSFFTIEQAHAGIVQRLGKFLRVAPPGSTSRRRSSTPWSPISRCRCSSST